MNLIELISRHAERVFGTKAKAEAWLNKPTAAFGGITPLQCALSESGYILVRSTLERIHHGYIC
ncbi:antitoxin Xre/MbcA/ParS toxin-binding domain-containing protein [Pseudomonas sp. zjy_13]|uniref:antitoxin Xre/MbcA/ParS toxin-binding domain-containing protein n=1 Tax=Pseudomonas sp. zjy_13 TaxID=3367263 RepID=UPI00370B52AF